MRLTASSPAVQSRRIVRMATVTMLALVLLWAQTWGQWHGVLHAKSAPQVLPGVVKKLVYTDGHAGQAAASEQAVLGHDAGDAQCRLLDQLSHADSLPCVPLPVLPLGLSAALVAQSVGLAVARWAALFQARAPPSFR